MLVKTWQWTTFPDVQTRYQVLVRLVVTAEVTRRNAEVMVKTIKEN